VRALPRATTAVTLASALLAGCSGGGPQAPPGPVAVAPAPPAACLLDVDALAATTGLTWTPDTTTASDRRCVYDPGGGGGLDFVGVDVVLFDGGAIDGGAAAAELEALSGVCTDGTVTTVPAGEGAFVCRFQGGSVFSAVVTGGRLVTVAASAVPAGTTADALAAAFTTELTRIGA
jgi:hypothetical protein